MLILAFTRMLRKDGRTDGSVTISLRNFVGEGIVTDVISTVSFLSFRGPYNYQKVPKGTLKVIKGTL